MIWRSQTFLKYFFSIPAVATIQPGAGNSKIMEEEEEKVEEIDEDLDGDEMKVLNVQAFGKKRASDGKNSKAKKQKKQGGNWLLIQWLTIIRFQCWIIQGLTSEIKTKMGSESNTLSLKYFDGAKIQQNGVFGSINIFRRLQNHQDYSDPNLEITNSKNISICKNLWFCRLLMLVFPENNLSDGCH